MNITPSQTVGPFFRIGAAWMETPNLVPADSADSADSAAAISLTGQVFDGAGAPVSDAMVEIWHADPNGAFPRDWQGFGRRLTDEDGRFAFLTVKPGRVDSGQAPHIDVSIFARGLLQRLVTRMYFPDEEEANAADPVLTSIEQPVARATLVAVGTPPDLRFDIHLQGDDETVFFVY